MQLIVETIRLERQVEGPDIIRMRLRSPTGESIDLVEQVGRGSGELWLGKHLGAVEYEHFEVTRTHKPAKPILVIEEVRRASP